MCDWTGTNFVRWEPISTKMRAHTTGFVIAELWNSDDSSSLQKRRLASVYVGRDTGRRTEIVGETRPSQNKRSLLKRWAEVLKISVLDEISHCRSQTKRCKNCGVIRRVQLHDAIFYSQWKEKFCIWSVEVGLWIRWRAHEHLNWLNISLLQKLNNTSCLRRGVGERCEHLFQYCDARRLPACVVLFVFHTKRCRCAVLVRVQSCWVNRKFVGSIHKSGYFIRNFIAAPWLRTIVWTGICRSTWVVCERNCSSEICNQPKKHRTRQGENSENGIFILPQIPRSGPRKISLPRGLQPLGMDGISSGTKRNKQNETPNFVCLPCNDKISANKNAADQFSLQERQSSPNLWTTIFSKHENSRVSFW